MNNRQQVVSFLAKNKSGRHTAKQISEAVGRPEASISAMLSLMYTGGQVSRILRKNGKRGRGPYEYALTEGHPALRHAPEQILDHLSGREPQTSSEVREALPWIEGALVSRKLCNMARRGVLTREGEPARGGVGGYRYGAPEPTQEPGPDQDALPFPEATDEPDAPPEDGGQPERPADSNAPSSTLLQRLNDIYGHALEIGGQGVPTPHRVEALRFAANIAERIHHLQQAG